MSDKIYITAAGASALRAELRYLWKDKRPKVTQQVADAAALGDRSENADYIYGKKQLREIDKRVRYLEKRLDQIEVVDRVPKDTSRIYFGAWGWLQPDTGPELKLRIIGEDEIDLKRGWISLKSPVARSLMGKREGDDVLLDRPAGPVNAEILKVNYEGFGDES